ncbi:MAG: glutaminyl-peptide cyclotransferase [Planctomycetes bacterium]|nr:glutaminyl-peptide cyclotransferase [Planctomycetota bacterium]
MPLPRLLYLAYFFLMMQVGRAQVPVLFPRVQETYPHDTGAFTQGLLCLDGNFYESTGLYGESSLRRVAVASGKVLERIDLSPQIFAEGLALHGEEFYLLTWKNGRAFVFDRKTLSLKRELTYKGQGWGLCSDGHSLIMSDGSPTLVWRDPVSFKETRRLSVREGSRPIPLLNELEWIGGVIYANIWMSSLIACIDPASGEVLSWLDLRELVRDAGKDGRIDVLNGIAADLPGGSLCVTGKLWPRMYRIDAAGLPGFAAAGNTEGKGK